ncbi:MAG TPA: TonB-dependent receptor [bacterium]|nr:TonB-dependent receptor [bacterium]
MAAVIIITLLSTGALLAQPARPGNSGFSMPTGTVSGQVYDADLNAPIEYANVVLRSLPDSTQVNGAATDNSGRFTITGVRPGRYFVDLSFIGYRDKRVDNITVGPGAARDLGRLTLKQSALAVQGVEATAERPVVTLKIDKKVIDVAHQQTVASGTAVDVLENVPSVKVDPDGNVTLRGSGNFKVLVDGRPSPLDPSEALQQIPASTIDNIELITNPSAKYDPEGMAGIMNVILKKQRQLGINGIANLRGGTDGSYGGDFLLGYRQGIANLFAGADYNRRQFGRKRQSDRWTVDSTGKDTLFTSTSGNNTRYGLPYGVRAGGDLQVTKQNLLSLGGRYGSRSFGSSQTAVYAESTRPGAGAYTYNSVDAFNRNGNFYMLNLDDAQDFGKKKGHQLTAHADLVGRSGTELQTTVLTDSAGDTTSGQRTTGTGPDKELTLKLDYALPLRKDDKLEAGYQSRFDLSRDSSYAEQYDPASHSFEYQAAYSHWVDFRDNFHALYGLYSGNLGKFGYQLGLRGEYTDRLVKLLDIDSSVTVRGWDLFPTVHASYNFPGEKQIMASYTRRIERPEGWDLEPFITWFDAYDVRQGDPALKSENIDSYEAGYQMPFGPSQLSVDGYYRVTHNVMDDILSVYPGYQNVILRKSANIGTDRSLGGELTCEYRPRKWWTVSLNDDAYDYRLALDPAIAADSTVHTFIWSGNLTNDFQILPQTRFQVVARYQAPEVSAQGTETGSYIFNASVRQQLFDRKLALVLQVRDILGTGGNQSSTQGPGFYTHSNTMRPARIVSLSLNWNFNNFKLSNRLQNDNIDNGGDTGQ